MNDKEYQGLRVDNGFCTGCGACVSEAPEAISMKWDEDGFLYPYAQEVIAEDVLKVCPFNMDPGEAVKSEDQLAEIFLTDASQQDDKLGRFENTYAGYSVAYRETSSSGGLATYIFEQLLLEGVVDHLFVVKEYKGSYSYQFFTDVAEIKKISKTRYIPVTMEELFLKIDSIEGKIGVSGVGCFLKAVRLKQHYHPHLKDKIPFLVGIICGGWKSKFFTEFLAQSAGLGEGYEKQEYRLKDPKSTASDYSFGAFDAQNSHFKTMKMAKVGDMWGTGLFKARACDFCTDVTTELADISLGDAWLPEYRPDGLGTSVIVTRSKIADDLIVAGMANKSLAVAAVSKDKIIQSQKSSFSHRHDGIAFRKRLEKLKGNKTPYIRPRIGDAVALPYQLVQFQRGRVRARSLKYWRETKQVIVFNKKMKMDLKVLRLLTKIYHKLR